LESREIEYDDRTFLKDKEMNLPRILLITILLLTLGVGVNSQQPPKAVLVDEFGKLSCCCDLSARIDIFMQELSRTPDSVGYIVLGDSRTPTQLWRERYFDGYISYRRFDEDRVVIVRRSGFDDPLHTQLWVVPPGATMGGQSLPDVEYIFPEKKRKQLFFNGIFTEDSLCYTGPPFRLLSKYLNADAGLTANIAIAAQTARLFRKTRDETIERFKSQYQTDVNRLRFFHVREDYEQSEFEIWVVRKIAQ
jgi:hypothetical protein